MTYDEKFPTITRDNITDVAKEILEMLQAEECESGTFFSLRQMFSGYGHVKVKAFINERHFKNLPASVIESIRRWSKTCEGNRDHLITLDEWPVENDFLEMLEDALEVVLENQDDESVIDTGNVF